MSRVVLLAWAAGRLPVRWHTLHLVVLPGEELRSSFGAVPVGLEDVSLAPHHQVGEDQTPPEPVTDRVERQWQVHSARFLLPLFGAHVRVFSA